jgi:hypothetical protein
MLAQATHILEGLYATPIATTPLALCALMARVMLPATTSLTVNSCASQPAGWGAE